MSELESVREIVERISMSRDRTKRWRCGDRPPAPEHTCPIGGTCGCCGICLAICEAAASQNQPATIQATSQMAAPAEKGTAPAENRSELVLEPPGPDSSDFVLAEWFEHHRKRIRQLREMGCEMGDL